MLLTSALEFEAAPKVIAIKSHCRLDELSVGTLWFPDLRASDPPAFTARLPFTQLYRGNSSPAKHASFCGKRFSVPLTKDSALGSLT